MTPPLEILRLSLWDLALCGYLLILWRALRGENQHSLFALMLAADFLNVLLVSPYNTALMTTAEMIVIALRAVAWAEAIAGVMRWLGENYGMEREWILLTCVCIGILVASVTLGLYQADELAFSKNTSAFTHAGCVVSGIVLLLYCHLYAVPVYRHDQTHLVLLLVWYTAVVAALISYPKAGEMVKWQWVNCGYRLVVMACLIGWERLTRPTASSSAASASAST